VFCEMSGSEYEVNDYWPCSWYCWVIGILWFVIVPYVKRCVERIGEEERKEMNFGISHL